MGGVVALLKDSNAIASGLRDNVTITMEILHHVWNVIEDLESILVEFQEILLMVGAVASAKELFRDGGDQAREFAEKTIGNGVRYMGERCDESRAKVRLMKDAIRDHVTTPTNDGPVAASDHRDQWAVIGPLPPTTTDQSMLTAPLDAAPSTTLTNNAARDADSNGQNERRWRRRGTDQEGEIMALLRRTVVSSCQTILELIENTRQKGGPGDDNRIAMQLIARYFTDRLTPGAEAASMPETASFAQDTPQDDAALATDTVTTAILMELATIIESSFIAMETFISHHRRDNESAARDDRMVRRLATTPGIS